MQEDPNGPDDPDRAQAEDVANVLEEIVEHVVVTEPGTSAGPALRDRPPNPSASSVQRHWNSIRDVKQMYEIYRSTMAQFTDSGSDINLRHPIRKIFSRQSVGVPPSYSTVMKLTDDNREIGRDARSMEAHHLSPFATRVPPPSYSQIEGGWTDVDSESSIEAVFFGPDPVYVWCSRCSTIVVTVTQCQRTKFTHITAAALFLCGCWPCCFLPYCINSCKNIYHYCPECSTLLGSYRPW